MAASNRSPSPSPPPTLPQVDPEAIVSHRFVRLRRLYTDALRSTLAANSYSNFSACFPTPAKYCPSALEGVWKQLNTRLEEECVKDFEKICHEKDLERALASWEQLIEDAKTRKTQAEETQLSKPPIPMHLLSAQDLHTAYLTPTLVRAETELRSKIDNVQAGNKDMISRIAKQRIEMQRLVEQLERMVEDVEGAAKVIEDDPMREDLRRGIENIGGTDTEDVKMGG